MREEVGSSTTRPDFSLRIGCVLLTLVAGMCVFAQTYITNWLEPPGPASEFAAEINDRDVLEGNTETKFPVSATDIRGFVDGFRDVTTYARFTIPAIDLDEFLASTSCETLLYTKNTRENTRGPSDLSWWQPHKAEHLQWCHDGRQHFGRMIFVDMTRQDTYIVYIVASVY